MKSEGFRNLLFMLLLPLILLLAISAPAHGGQMQYLTGHIPPEIARFHLKPVGRLAGAEQLSLVIGLPLRNGAEFRRLLQNIYDPASPEYHHYLTPQQIADRFGPTERDYEAVGIFAQTNGLQIVRTHNDRTLLRVEGSVADIERTFHVRMLVYPHPTEARTFYAPDTEPSVALTVPILHISGLNNYNLPHPGGGPGGGQSSNGAKPGSGSGPGGNYWGSDFRAAYVPGTSLTGAGQSIALLELDGYYTNDILSYEQQADLPNVTITNVLVDGATGTPSTFQNSVGEVSLDMEMAIAMAPGISRLIVYEAPNCCYYWVDELKQMQEDDSARQLSSSWLFDFDDPLADPIYQEMAMQGQTFFQCSGDDLAFYIGVTQWTDDPNVTLVGGTQLTTTSNGSWAGEIVWNNGDGAIGSGGGVSLNSPGWGDYPLPTWQQGINMQTNGGSATNRNVPDVSMVAEHAWVIWNNGAANWWWGTSIAAPLWAGLAALANQQAAARSEPPLGFLNPVLYDIGKSPLYSTCFHDVTEGNNTNQYSPNLYFAEPGYDLCTGWGSPNGVNLIDVLTATLAISDPVGNSAGYVTLSSLCLPGSTNVVVCATNLTSPVEWQALSTNIAGTAGTWQFTDTNAPLYKTRFYRFRSY